MDYRVGGMLIADMFTGELTAPKLDHYESDDGFDDFWASWPSGTRKVAKQQCRAKWIKHALSGSAKHILAHVVFMKTQEDWLKGNGSFICAPIVYLNQQRWADWIPDTRPTFDPVAATRELLAERDRNYCPPSSDIKAKLAALRKEMRA